MCLRQSVAYCAWLDDTPYSESVRKSEYEVSFDRNMILQFSTAYTDSILSNSPAVELQALMPSVEYIKTYTVNKRITKIFTL